MTEITSFTQFKNSISTGLSIINVKSEKCSVCVSVTAQLKDLLSDVDINSYYLYVDKVEEFSGQYLVFTVPTVLIFENGKEILRESRFIDFKKIKRVMDMSSS